MIFAFFVRICTKSFAYQKKQASTFDACSIITIHY